MNRDRRHYPNFDHIARAYRWLEYLALGTALEQIRFHHLPHLAQYRESCKTALILGDGDGRFTARLLSANPQLKADAVDLSVRMLALLESRCATAVPEASHRLRVHQQDALEYASELPAVAYDLVCTHFFLDCLTRAEVDQLLRAVSPALTPGALWLVSEFRIPGGWLHWPARLYIRGLYFAFRLLTGLRTTHLPDYRSALQNAGFHTVATHRALFGLLTAELWQTTTEGVSAPDTSDSAK